MNPYFADFCKWRTRFMSGPQIGRNCTVLLYYEWKLNNLVMHSSTFGRFSLFMQLNYNILNNFICCYYNCSSSINIDIIFFDSLNLCTITNSIDLYVNWWKCITKFRRVFPHTSPNVFSNFSGPHIKLVAHLCSRYFLTTLYIYSI